MAPRQRSVSTDFLSRARRQLDAHGRVALGGMSSVGAASRARGGAGQSVLTNTGGEGGESSGAGQLLVLSATADSIASGGDYVTFDTQVYRQGFESGGVSADGTTVTWPVSAVGVVQVEWRWDSYQGGGTIEIEVDGEVPDWGTVVAGSSGQTVVKARRVDIVESAQVKIKVTQSSGSAQTADVHVEFGVLDPTAGGSGKYEPLVLSTGPLGYWKLDESSGTTAADSSGNGNDGTYRNSPTLGVAGVMTDGSGATAVDFNGSSQAVDVGDLADFEFTGSVPFSVEAWVNIDAFNATGFNLIVGKQLGTSGEGWEFQVLSTGELLLVRVAGGVAKGVETAAGRISTGTRYHLVGTFDGTDGRLYINGVLVATADISGSMSATSAPLALMYDGASDDHHVDGKGDEIAVYGRALTDVEVAEHWNTGRSR